MIGSGLKKLAAKNGLQVARGVAYGDFHGYAATFSEGAGYKRIVLTTRIPDAQKKAALQSTLEAENLMKRFRVTQLNILEDGIGIVFHDNPGTMKMLNAFCDWFFPLLDESGATGTDVCNECGEAFDGNDGWKLINGAAFRLHEHCALGIREAEEKREREQAAQDDGGYIKGAVGAFLGALIGAIAWAVVMCLGYVAALVGLLIGWLSKKGYEKLHGREGRGKVFILIAACIFAVIVGTLLADAVMLAQMIVSGEAALAFADILPSINYLMVNDAAYRAQTLGNMGQGLLFAALGTFGMLWQTHKENKSMKMIDLP